MLNELDMLYSFEEEQRKEKIKNIINDFQYYFNRNDLTKERIDAILSNYNLTINELSRSEVNRINYEVWGD